MKKSAATSRRAFLRALAVTAAAAPLAVAGAARAQDMGRGGVLDIRNDAERRLFNELQCTCGCPRESIGTCTCDYAARFRSEVRAMMAEGMSDELVRAEWVRRYGPQALMVPPNEGGNRLLYLAPLVAIIGGAALVVTLLRRFRRREDEKTAAAAATAGAPSTSGGARDDYDDKLDEELKQLDDE